MLQNKYYNYGAKVLPLETAIIIHRRPKMVKVRLAVIFSQIPEIGLASSWYVCENIC
jgi:hypothetical protein